jgi:hypothetical protein
VTGPIFSASYPYVGLVSVTISDSSNDTPVICHITVQ